MKKKILIDLDILTTAIWDKEKKSVEFLREAKNKYRVLTPLFIVVHILRNWKYKKLVDKIVAEIDKVSDEFLTRTKVNTELEKKVGVGLREFVRKGVKETGIKNKLNITLIVFASLAKVDYIVTLDEKHLKRNEKKIASFLKRNNLYVPQIVLLSEKGLLSSFSSSQLFLKIFPYISFQFLSNFLSSNFLRFFHIIDLIQGYLNFYMW